MEMQSIFQNLDTIVRDVFILTNNLKLQCRVNLSSKSSTGGRLAADYAKSYNSNKFNDRSQMSSLNLKTSDYFVLSYSEYTDNVSNFEEIYLSYNNIITFNKELAQFSKNLKTNYDELYFYDGNELNINVELANELSVLIEDLPMDKSVMISPNVYVDKDDNTVPGITMFINLEENFTTFPIDRFNSFKKILADTNLLELSQNLINFAAMSVLFNSQGGQPVNKPESIRDKKKLSNNTLKSKFGDLKSKKSLPERKPKQSINNNNKKVNSIKTDNDPFANANEKVIDDPFANVETPKTKKKKTTSKSKKSSTVNPENVTNEEIENFFEDDEEKETTVDTILDDEFDDNDDDDDSYDEENGVLNILNGMEKIDDDELNELIEKEDVPF